jgi:Chromosome segregation ATPases
MYLNKMIMKNVVLFCTGFLILCMTSCNNSGEYKALKERNDSLLLASTKANIELEEVLSLLNEVEDNFNEIKTAENYLTVQSATGGERTQSTRERIATDMKLVAETLTKNRDQIEELEKKLKNSGIQSTELRRTVQRLQNELKEKTEALATLQALLAAKDVQIAELSETVTSLVTNLQSLQKESEQQKKVIDTHEKQDKIAYFCFGTSKELKDQKILEKGQLGTNFNKDYFIRIKDIYAFSEIPLVAKKAKLISKHPTGTYEYKKESNGNLIFVITDPNTFWSITRYLVIEVN